MLEAATHTATATQVSVRTTCRVCDHGELTPVLSLGDQYVSNFVEAEDAAALRAPLELVLCSSHHGGCGLLQLRHTVNAELMYRNYWYRSGVNQSMQQALSDIARQATAFAHLVPGDIVVDTGSNDNTLLKAYPTAGLTRVGFEPASTLMPYAHDGAEHVVNNFFTVSAWQELGLAAPAKVITSIAMFYDLDDPNTFAADVAAVLDPHGVWIIQMAYLPAMLRDNMFDNICHEHLEYYSLLSLQALLARHHLTVIDVEFNRINGGSIRAYITHEGSRIQSPVPGAAARIADAVHTERSLALDQLAPYRAFATRVANIKEQVVSFITQEVAAGKSVYAYGASTKGNTLLQYFGLDHRVITAAAERNPDKYGRKTVGTHIPIISEEDARAVAPDYFLVLPWHFLSEFQARERKWLEAGGTFIVPLPTFQLVGAT